MNLMDILIYIDISSIWCDRAEGHIQTPCTDVLVWLLERQCMDGLYIYRRVIWAAMRNRDYIRHVKNIFHTLEIHVYMFI